MTMLMPSIALPTGPYDWHDCVTSCETYHQRLGSLRAVMRDQGVTHCVVHGNGFDHATLAWLSNFTPKLGPALMLVSLSGLPRLLFSGGPTMKPSAKRLTWIEDVSALRDMGKDVAAWLDGSEAGCLGIVAGTAMLLGDWHSLEKVAGSGLIALDEQVDEFRLRTDEEVDAVRASAGVLQKTAEHIFRTAREGAGLHQTVIDGERLAYRSGAQDVRLRIARKPWGKPVTLPDMPMAISGSLPVALAVRYQGYWAYGDFLLGNMDAIAFEVRKQMETSMHGHSYANKVSFPESEATSGKIQQARVQVNGARFSGLFIAGTSARDWLFLPPGLG